MLILWAETFGVDVHGGDLLLAVVDDDDDDDDDEEEEPKRRASPDWNTLDQCIFAARSPLMFP